MSTITPATFWTNQTFTPTKWSLQNPVALYVLLQEDDSGTILQEDDARGIGIEDNL